MFKTLAHESGMLRFMNAFLVLTIYATVCSVEYYLSAKNLIDLKELNFELQSGTRRNGFP